jgi:hypothetical protein
VNVARTLVSLYPRPFKEHWGAALEGDAQAAGWRCWPNVLVSLLGMWVHPAIWPAASRSQRRLRAANLAVAVTAVGWLVGHAVVEVTTSVPRGLAHSWILSACDGLTFFGFALILPFPRLTRRAVTELVDRAARLLAVPVLLGGLVVVMVLLGSAMTVGHDRPAGIVAGAGLLALAAATIGTVRDLAQTD